MDGRIDWDSETRERLRIEMEKVKTSVDWSSSLENSDCRC